MELDVYTNTASATGRTNPPIHIFFYHHALFIWHKIAALVILLNLFFP